MKLKWRRDRGKRIRLIADSAVYGFVDKRSGKLVVTASELTP